jgi:hypothetical protein
MEARSMEAMPMSAPMFVRAIETTVALKRPIMSHSIDCAQPAETYRLAMNEERILGPSFPAFRHKATAPRISALSISGRPNQVFPFASVEIAAGQEARASLARPTRLKGHRPCVISADSLGAAC